jgi:hypothetical protein
VLLVVLVLVVVVVVVLLWMDHAALQCSSPKPSPELRCPNTPSGRPTTPVVVSDAFGRSCCRCCRCC